jgi:integrase
MARGSIKKRYYKKSKNGINYTYVIIYYVNGKQKWETVGPNLKEAQRLLAQRNTEVSNGTYFKPADISFREISKKWLSNKESRVKPSTFRGYKGDLNAHLIPALGNMPLSSISREKVEKVLNNIRKRRAAETANNIRLTLYGILKYARSLKYILENPAEEVKPFPLEHKEMDFLSPREIRGLLESSEASFKPIAATAILTGMRRGEILGLQWGDIDWNCDTIFVRRSLYWLVGNENAASDTRWKFIAPKSRRSKRAIVMSPRLKEILEVHKITARENKYELVFCNKEGNPIDPDNMIKREFHPALRLAGLRKIRFHDLRHTYATLLIHLGENIKFIQNQMGHASIQTTIDRYGHLLPVDKKGVGLKLDGQVFCKEYKIVEEPKVEYAGL